MQVTETLTFDEYWSDSRYHAKKPVRNGSRTMMLGDNIYHRVAPDGVWVQEDSHHSLPDGSPDHSNISNDTSANRVLISELFTYFGSLAPRVPQEILDEMQYRNQIGHRAYSTDKAMGLLQWFKEVSYGRIGALLADPFQFRDSAARYSSGTNKLFREFVE